ncbi:MAG: hypothetical protein ACXVH2_05860 [Methanobacterium sp.]
MENRDKEANTGNKKDNELVSEEEEKEEKIEICFICHKKFDINKDDESYYRHGKYPMCAYCAEFYGFYR